MPISCRIDDAKKRVYARATGLIGLEELLSHMNAVSSGPASTYPELLDCTDATTDLTGDQVRRLVDARSRIASTQPAGPVAIVANVDIVYGMFRMFEMLTSELRPIHIFRDRVAAEKWLDDLRDLSKTSSRQ